MDGNRRWAKEQGLPALKGHKRGAEVFKEISLAAFERGVTVLSAFVFSTDNWKRAEDEVGYLMKLVITASEKYLDEFDKKGIKIMVIGRRDNIRLDVLKAIQQTEEKTKNNTRGKLVLCFNYGGQQEIIDSVTKLTLSVKNKRPTVEIFEQNLYSPEVPPLDLIIRTSGEKRLSGFMLWRAAYAELRFIDKYWPDFTPDDLDEALADYASRQRRFGS